MANEQKLTEKREIFEYLKDQDAKGFLDKSTLAKWAKIGIDVRPNKDAKPPETDKKASGRLSVDKDIYAWYKANHSYDNTAWLPKSVIYHDDDFWNWINSITLGFVTEKIYYEPFEKYKAQAQYFMDTARNPYDNDNIELRREIIMEEYAKIDCNSMYFSMKYGKVKEGNSRTGKIDYVPKEHNAIIYYLLDCGYSFILGKPRQIFATTTLGLFIIKKLITQENFYMKFITEDDKTGMEILDDKVKVAYGFLPLWMQPQVARDYIRGFRLGKKVNKGEYALPNSRIEVVPPSKTAINGGSPQIVLVDEVGNVPDLIPMVLEARPTMYIDANQDGNLKLARQLVAWGCVCAGTKVWDNDGNVYNIESLPIDNGILGYDGNNASKETITYWQEAREKECVRITTNVGRTLECSFDHPILTSDNEFVPARNLSINSGVWVASNDCNNKYNFKKEHFYLEYVVSVEDIGVKPVYNLTANTTNTYIANGIVTHNTGVSDNKGKNAFQNLWTNTLDFWEKKDYKSAIFVPVFFSWHARCGNDTYDSEMKSYYNGDKKEFDGLSQEEQKAIFHMHYPSTWRDMFAMASSKLVPRGIINDNLAKIRNSSIADLPVEGYFKPIYDITHPYDDNFYERTGVQYKIVGATFVAMDDSMMEDIVPSVWMYKRPEKGWLNRYYKGVDPIMTDVGNSLFASVVWDAQEMLPSCVMNYRKAFDPKGAYLQSLLMALYYDTENIIPQGCPELIENNIGSNYVDFIQMLGFGRNLVYNAQLQPELRGGGALWGINTKAQRKQTSVSKLHECVMTYHKNFYYDVIFKQLDTYVPVAKSTGTGWEPVDKRMYHDDVLDALAFAYICRQSYSHKNPEKIGDDKKEIVTVKKKLVRGGDGLLRWEYQRKSVIR